MGLFYLINQAIGVLIALFLRKL